MSPTTTAVVVAVFSIAAVGCDHGERSGRRRSRLRAVRARVAPRHAMPTWPRRQPCPSGWVVHSLRGRSGELVDDRLGVALRLTGYTVPTVIGTDGRHGRGRRRSRCWSCSPHSSAPAQPRRRRSWWLLVPVVAVPVRLASGRRRSSTSGTPASRAAPSRQRLRPTPRRRPHDEPLRRGRAHLRRRRRRRVRVRPAPPDHRHRAADGAHRVGRAPRDGRHLRPRPNSEASPPRSNAKPASVSRSPRRSAPRPRRCGPRQLADITDRADKANANLSLPTMGMVFGMVLFLAYPDHAADLRGLHLT